MQVQVWFRNRRQRVRLSKLKRDGSEGAGEEDDEGDEEALEAEAIGQAEMEPQQLSVHLGLNTESGPVPSHDDTEARSEAASDETTSTAPGSPLHSIRGESLHGGLDAGLALAGRAPTGPRLGASAPMHGNPLAPMLLEQFNQAASRAMEIAQTLEGMNSHMGGPGRAMMEPRQNEAPVRNMLPTQPPAKPPTAFEPSDHHRGDHTQSAELMSSYPLNGLFYPSSAGMQRPGAPPTFCPIGLGSQVQYPMFGNGMPFPPNANDLRGKPMAGAACPGYASLSESLYGDWLAKYGQYEPMIKGLPQSQAQLLMTQLQLQSRLFPSNVKPPPMGNLAPFFPGAFPHDARVPLPRPTEPHAQPALFDQQLAPRQGDFGRRMAPMADAQPLPPMIGSQSLEAPSLDAYESMAMTAEDFDDVFAHFAADVCA